MFAASGVRFSRYDAKCRVQQVFWVLKSVELQPCPVSCSHCSVVVNSRLSHRTQAILFHDRYSLVQNICSPVLQVQSQTCACEWNVGNLLVRVYHLRDVLLFRVRLASNFLRLRISIRLNPYIRCELKNCYI